ncbi:UNVERIFIED_CONTAM: putative pectinesterase/pectinesterase inhibitor 22 [Sesamum calycinum]|uniref:Pectinesterase n=1 Tax=Sesamum calycinum TaxID=2727403 RepID=A0AAW2J5M5_9LAMI
MAIDDCKELLDFSVSELACLPFRPPRNNGTAANDDSGNKGFPKWMTEGDKELLLSSQKGMHADAVVAVDGSGQYRSIAQAIYEAPSYSNRRYVIYVKKGVYKENIDMKKKKTNIMLVGDGIGQTIVTGNRNFMQGWTTFRTATVEEGLKISAAPIQKHDPVTVSPLQAVYARRPCMLPPRMIHPAWKTRVREAPSAIHTLMRRITPNTSRNVLRALEDKDSFPNGNLHYKHIYGG